MATKKPRKMTDAQKKERRQQKLLNDYSKQQKWLIGAGIVILILILLLAAAIGYSYNWGQGVNKDSLRQVTPTSTTSDTAGEATTDAGGNGGTGGTGGGSGGGGTSTTNTGTNGSTSNTSNTGSSNTSTTKETSTTTNNTTTNNNNTSTPAPGILQQLLGDIQLGDTLDDIINRAQDLGVTVNCNVEVLIVKVCDFTENGLTITVRSLLSNGLINSILTNF